MMTVSILPLGTQKTCVEITIIQRRNGPEDSSGVGEEDVGGTLKVTADYS